LEETFDDTPVWGPYPSAVEEAHFLFREVNAGRNPAVVRASIGADEEWRLREFATNNPEFARDIGELLEFRHQVLVQFDRLVAQRHTGAITVIDGHATNPKTVRSCPLCGKQFGSMTARQWQTAFKLHSEYSLAHRVLA